MLLFSLGMVFLSQFCFYKLVTSWYLVASSGKIGQSTDYLRKKTSSYKRTKWRMVYRATKYPSG